MPDVALRESQRPLPLCVESPLPPESPSPRGSLPVSEPQRPLPLCVQSSLSTQCRALNSAWLTAAQVAKALKLKPTEGMTLIDTINEHLPNLPGLHYDPESDFYLYEPLAQKLNSW